MAKQLTAEMRDAATIATELERDAQAAFSPSNCSPSRFHLDLFSGIGGFALAAQWNGLATIGFSEIEPYACKILKRHWPDVPNYGDIRNVRNIRAHLITGGFPCQPFSVAGEQRGAEDDRHLWPEMCRVIAETRPAWVLGENVPGIIGMELDNVLSDLANLGYTCWPVVVPACAVDAKHRRDRVWIVAYDAERGWIGLKSPNARSGDSERWSQGETGGCGGSVADTDEAGRREQRRAESMGTTHATAQCDGENVADANGYERHGRASDVQMGRGGCASEAQDDGLSRSAEWIPEPGVGRVANGIPHRSHRLKGLGNAIVPQIAANLIHWMLECEMTWMENEKVSDRPADSNP